MGKKVIHFEIGCSHIQKTSEFYKNVFDWEIEQKGNSATIINQQMDGISGHLNKLGSGESQKYVTIYIETDSLKSNLKMIELNKGKVLVKPITLPDNRTFAWFEVVAGNTNWTHNTFCREN